MKISTALSFQRSLNTMQETSAQVAKTREQLATGKEIVRPVMTRLRSARLKTLIGPLPKKTPIRR